MTRRSLGPRSLKHGSFVLSALMALSMVLAACGAAGTATTHAGPPQPLIIVPNCGGDLVQNFNPFKNGSINSYGQFGPVYETLLFFNRVDGSIKPWLASSYSYSSDATQITFKLRQGVKWSDGQPFTADDVVYTWSVFKQYSDSDYLGIGGAFKTVIASDPGTVVVTLAAPSNSILYSLAGQTWIVAKHIWGSVGDPVNYTDKVPVGTGPYVFKSYTPQLIDFTKNPHFWQPGKPVVPEIRFPSCEGNTDAEPQMDADRTDWNGLFPTGDINQTFIQRDPAHNHYYLFATDPLMLFLNLTKAPFDQLNVRKAINLALDRNKISTVGESGYQPVAHPTGLILPGAQADLNPTYANATFTVDTAQAAQLLASAGYTKKGSDGILIGPNGKRFSVTADGVTGYTDWDSDYQIIAANLKAIGIEVKITDSAPDAVQTDLQNGNFDMAIFYANPGPTPWYIYNQVLASSNSAPIGQQATSNYERWSNSTSDSLLSQYDSTTDPATQKQDLFGLEQIVVEQLPVLFLTNEVSWYEYNTLKYVGWPDKGNLYAEPSPYSYPDDEIVLLTLHQ